MTYGESLLEVLSFFWSPGVILAGLGFLAILGFAMTLSASDWVEGVIGLAVTVVAIVFLIATFMYISSNGIGTMSWEKGAM